MCIRDRVGIVSSDDVNQQIYDSLLLLQHRGQDSTGIATMENTIFHIYKAKGQVNTAYRTRDMRNLIGKIGLGHVRYATKGSAESVEEAQPFYVKSFIRNITYFFNVYTRMRIYFNFF